MTKGSSTSKDYEELIRRAKEQPGVAELIKVYGDYDLLLKQTNEYLSGGQPTVVISTSSTSD